MQQIIETALNTAGALTLIFILICFAMVGIKK